MKIFVFDFDLTLSDVHTQGRPQYDKSYISQPQLNIVREHFLRIKQNENNLIMILSRTPQLILSNYIAKIYKDIYDLIDNMYGPNIKEYNDNTNERFWAQWKARYLWFIKYMHPNHDVIFFDDTEENIYEAENIKNIKAVHVSEPSYIGTLINSVLDEQEQTQKPVVYHEPTLESRTFTSGMENVNVPSTGQLTSETKEISGQKPVVYHEPTLESQTYISGRENVPTIGQLTSETKEVSSQIPAVDIEAKQEVLRKAVNKTSEFPSVRHAEEYYLNNPQDETIAIINQFDGNYINDLPDRHVFRKLTTEDEEIIKEIDRENAVDLTYDFNGDVGAAIRYFEDNPTDHRIAKVKSYNDRIYYYNSRLEPTEFEHALRMYGGKYPMNFSKKYFECKNNYLKLSFYNK